MLFFEWNGDPVGNSLFVVIGLNGIVFTPEEWGQHNILTVSKEPTNMLCYYSYGDSITYSEQLVDTVECTVHS